MASLETIEALLTQLAINSEKRLSHLEDDVYGSMDKTGIISLLKELQGERLARQRMMNRHIGAIWAAMIAFFTWALSHLGIK